jgi:hypothetical protein
MKILEKIEQQLDEVFQMVKLEGLPNIVIRGTTSQVQQLLKRKIRKPDDILSVERVTKGEMRKYFLELSAGGQGKEEEKEKEEEKVEEATGQNMLWRMLDQNKASKIMDYMDDQTQELLVGRGGILEKLGKQLTIPNNYGAAFNRFRNLIESGHKNEGIIRNQIFKIADELKIKLPSAMF